MTIESGEVPDVVMDAFMEQAPDFVRNVADAHFRPGVAAALTAWDGTPRDLMPLVAGHECSWTTVAAQHRDALLGIKQTDVLQRCDGCGDVRTQVLTGTWTLEQLRGTP